MADRQRSGLQNRIGARTSDWAASVLRVASGGTHMISSSEFVYNACTEALDNIGLNGGELVFPLVQNNPEEVTAVVYALVGETRYQALSGYDNTDRFEITVRSNDYNMMRKIDQEILKNLQVGSRLLQIESGADFVEDATNRQNQYMRRRIVDID